MGTNRRSRRRSAARIFHSNGHSKRQKGTTPVEHDSSFHCMISCDDAATNATVPVVIDSQQQAVTSVNDIAKGDGLAHQDANHSDNKSDHDSHSGSELDNDSFEIDVFMDSQILNIHQTQNNVADDTHEFSVSEICSYQLMSLLDQAGCPLNTYERVIALLRQQEKLGFSVKKAYSRQKLLQVLRQKYLCPVLESFTVNSCEVFRFPFLDMLQDLLDTAGRHLHHISPNAECRAGSWNDELWNTHWMSKTFQCPLYSDFNPEIDIMLPIILYIDKTGTDVLQRYSLEPVLFTVAALSRESRENRRFWRHLGFVPSSKSIDDSQDSLQFYHNCLAYILEGLQLAQTEKPLVKVTKANGINGTFRAHIPVMIIMGDQLSQDTICCRRKANAGGAGRVHRSCMCSYMSVDDYTSKCRSVPKQVIEQLITYSTRSETEFQSIIDNESSIEDKTAAKSRNSTVMKYLRKQKQVFNTILNRPFTTHSVFSAFSKIDFGSWESGVYDATFDDFMHSAEEGLIENIGSTLFDGLVPSEAEKIETLMIPLLTSIRSSSRNTFPRWRLQKGFSRQTLMTMGERVGSIFSLSLALHDKKVADIIHNGHARQRTKYLHFPQATSVKDNNTSGDITSDPNQETVVSSGKPDDYPYYYEQYMHPMTLDQCKDTLIHLYRHGFDITLLETLDTYQIHQLIAHTSSCFEKTSYPTSYPDHDLTTMGLYIDKGKNLVIDKRLVKLVHSAMNPKPEDLLTKHRFFKVDKVAPKHHRKKTKQKGDGSSAAFLGSSIPSLIMFLEYTLCFHAFCKYSSILPLPMQKDIELVEFSGRSLLTYFARMIYRGDSTIDSRTAKIHTQRRLGHNFRCLGNVMHSCCEIGERLLKTEAKKISRTAQQRGSTVFERQTCSRIIDRHLLEKMGRCLEPATDNTSTQAATQGTDSFSRQQPHFVILRQNAIVLALDRKGRRRVPDMISGNLNPFIVQKLLEIEPLLDEIPIYNEVILRDGSYVRAFPSYRKEGPWHDFVNIQWEDDGNNSYLLPAQCLTFYQKETLLALVHSVDLASAGKVSGYTNSVLTTHYNMQYSRSGSPSVYSVNCAAIDSTLLGIYHDPSSSLLDYSRKGVMIVRPRNEWAYAWYQWNVYLRTKNHNRSLSKPFIDLGSTDMVNAVRKMILASTQEFGRSRDLQG